ncbi:MAG: TonB-dependent receptor [Myxococcales bacterium]|nr:TonB-dependent receptor [Myxococcales bacterium]
MRARSWSIGLGLVLSSGVAWAQPQPPTEPPEPPAEPREAPTEPSEPTEAAPEASPTEDEGEPAGEAAPDDAGDPETPDEEVSEDEAEPDPPVAADEEPDIELQPEELEELNESWDISVFGSAREITRVAGAAYRVDEEQLERFEDDNIHRTLQRVPGVYVRGEDGYGLRPNIGMRGASSDRSKKIALMEDGVLLGPAPYSAPAAYYFPLSTRMTAIEVFKGPSGIRFGPNTIGGAINMVTRPIPWGHQFGSDLAFGTESYGKGHAYYGYGTDHWGVLVEGVRLRSNGFKIIDGAADNTGGNSGFDKIETMLKARVNTDPAGEIYNEGSIKLGYSREVSRETYLGLSDEDFRATPLRRYAASSLDAMKWNRFQIELSHALGVGDWLRMRTTAYRHDFDRSWFRFNDFVGASVRDVLADPNDPLLGVYYQVLNGADSVGESFAIVNNHRTFVSQGIQSSAQIQLPKISIVEQRLVVGARLHNDSINRVHTDSFFVQRHQRPIPSGADDEVITDNRGSAIAVAAHLVDEISLWRFFLTPGVRVEYILTDFDDHLTGRRNEGKQHAILPGLGMLFQASENVGILAGVHQGFSPVTPGQPPGSKPEVATNYEMGGRFTSTLANLETIGFVSDYHNLTFECSFSSGCEDRQLDQQASTGRALIWGVEASGRADVPTPVDLTIPVTAAYTFTHATFRDDFEASLAGDPVNSIAIVQAGDRIPFVPSHQVAATAGLASKRWGSLVLGGTFVDAMREVAGRGEPAPNQVTDAYVVFDLAATLQVVQWLSVYAKVENLLNNSYLISRLPFGARPGRPRFFYAGIKVSLGR